ncbi:aspartate 1-decarboxylase [Candidatus Omnitrophota bacterium]
MLRLMCKSKIHRAAITRCNIHYKGSVGIDADLLKAGDILPYEIVQVINVDTGARFETYAIEEKRGSGELALYGGAARLGKIGETVIIISSAILSSREARAHRPKIVLVGRRNKIIKKGKK